MVTSDDEYDDFLATAGEDIARSPSPSTSQPQSVLGKRTRVADDDGDTDDGNGEGEALEEDHQRAPPTPTSATPRAGSVNRNYVAYARRVATQKRLRSDETMELLDFVADTPLGRETRLYATLLATSRKVDGVIQSQPPWTPSPELSVNIKSYALGILLSGQLSSYKGKVTNEHLEASRGSYSLFRRTQISQKILKRKRFDLPVGIEKNPASWKKVYSLVEDAFTQHRSTIKKMLVKSVKGNPEDHWSIYELTTKLCDGTLCEPSVPLCARLAFLRYIYLKNPNRDMWDTVNQKLENIRKRAAGKPDEITRYFRGILTKDRELHGPQDNDNLGSTVSTESAEWQQEIDEMISGVGM